MERDDQRQVVIIERAASQRDTIDTVQRVLLALVLLLAIAAVVVLIFLVVSAVGGIGVGVGDRLSALGNAVERTVVTLRQEISD